MENVNSADNTFRIEFIGTQQTATVKFGELDVTTDLSANRNGKDHRLIGTDDGYPILLMCTHNTTGIEKTTSKAWHSVPSPEHRTAHQV